MKVKCSSCGEEVDGGRGKVASLYLADHFIRHTKYKPYACLKCSRKFSTSTDATDHAFNTSHPFKFVRDVKQEEKLHALMREDIKKCRSARESSASSAAASPQLVKRTARKNVIATVSPSSDSDSDDNSELKRLEQERAKKRQELEAHEKLVAEMRQEKERRKEEKRREKEQREREEREKLEQEQREKREQEEKVMVEQRKRAEKEHREQEKRKRTSVPSVSCSPVTSQLSSSQVRCNMCNQTVSAEFYLRREHVSTEHADLVHAVPGEPAIVKNAKISTTMRACFPGRVASEWECEKCGCELHTRTAASKKSHAASHLPALLTCPFPQCDFHTAAVDEAVNHFKCVHSCTGHMARGGMTEGQQKTWDAGRRRLEKQLDALTHECFQHDDEEEAEGGEACSMSGSPSRRLDATFTDDSIEDSIKMEADTTAQELSDIKDEDEMKEESTRSSKKRKVK